MINQQSSSINLLLAPDGDCIARFQGYERFFPIRTSPNAASPALYFAMYAHGVHFEDGDTKNLLDRLPNFDFIGRDLHFKRILVKLLF